jgi:hypothetical protein
MRHCVNCNREAGKIIKGMCRSCYRKEWLKTEGGQRLTRRVANDRKLPVTMKSRVYHGDEREPNTVGFVSTQSKIPYATQELILRAYLEGREPAEIASGVDLETNLVKSVIDHGTISPRRVPAYRCPGCRHMVIAMPCFICVSKRTHRHSRKLWLENEQP